MTGQLCRVASAYPHFVEPKVSVPRSQHTAVCAYDE